MHGATALFRAEACDRLASIPSISHQSRSKIEWCLRIHQHLGNVFVFKDHFLRDPALLIELVKPLVHYNAVGFPGDSSKLAWTQKVKMCGAT